MTKPEDKRDAILAWIADESERVVALPVSNALDIGGPGQGKYAADILNFGHLRLLRVLADIVPSIDRQGFLPVIDKALVDKMLAAMVRHDLVGRSVGV